MSETSGILGDQLDNRANRGVSDFDRTHRFVLSFLWDLPRSAFARRSTVERSLFSNWQVSGIITAMSGPPVDIVDSGAGTFYYGPGGVARPNWSVGRRREPREASCHAEPKHAVVITKGGAKQAGR